MAGSILQSIFTPGALIMVLLGTAFGIVIGAIPGLGASIGVTVLLPFTYSMQPLPALLLLAGVFMGCGFGGSISGILLNIPGTSEAICTTVEGYPMLRKGRGKEALYYAAISSTIGGTIGVIVLILFAPALAHVALKFGPPEMMLVAMIGLTIIASLSADNFLKGIFGACFGMLVSMVGVDIVSGTARMTFGITSFTMGFKQVALALGLIAGRELIVQTRKALRDSAAVRLQGTDTGSKDIYLESISPWTALKNILKKPFTLLYSAGIGTFIGILPGAGAAIAAFVAYGEAKRRSKEPFGTGNPEGIVAAESANNAAVGGTFVPMLALGIPGSATCALIFSALTIHGIIPGPNLFTQYGDMTYGFMYGLLISVVVMGLIAIGCTPFLARIVKLKMSYIIPPVICCVVLGAFSIRNSMFDVYTAMAFTVIGYLFYKVKIAPAPVFLGYILGPIIEKNLLTSMTIAGAAQQNVLVYMLHRPLCIGITVVGIIMLYANIRTLRNERKTKHRING